LAAVAGKNGADGWRTVATTGWQAGLAVAWGITSAVVMSAVTFLDYGGRAESHRRSPVRGFAVVESCAASNRLRHPPVCSARSLVSVSPRAWWRIFDLRWDNDEGAPQWPTRRPVGDALGRRLAHDSPRTVTSSTDHLGCIKIYSFIFSRTLIASLLIAWPSPLGGRWERGSL
jgi:hypothetical protein